MSAAVQQKKQVWNQQALFCLWISQGWQLRRGWTGGKRACFCEHLLSQSRKRAAVNGRNLSRARDSCQSHAEGTAVAYRCQNQSPTRVNWESQWFYTRVHHTQNTTPSLYKMQKPETSQTCQDVSEQYFLEQDLWSLSQQHKHLSPCLMIYKEQYLDRNISQEIMLFCYT